MNIVSYSVTLWESLESSDVAVAITSDRAGQEPTLIGTSLVTLRSNVGTQLACHLVPAAMQKVVRRGDSV